jgi:hypothetical protein
MSEHGDDRHPLELPEEEQVVYELGEWPLDLQAAAAEALAESEIPHAFDGTDLVVHVDWEQSVDELLEDVERAAGGVPVAADAAVGSEDEAEIDSDELDDGEIVYELDDWTPEQREAVETRLTDAGIDHRWEDETSLVVGSAHEAVVENLLDDIEYPDALDVEPVDEKEAAEATSFEVLSAMYLAADRLKGHPLDAAGLADLTEAIEAADADVPPYGITPGLWHNAVDQANALADAVTDEDADRTPEVIEKATALRELLRPYV